MAKDFTIARNRREPLAFTLTAQGDDETPDVVEKFCAVGSVAGSLILDYVSSSTQGGAAIAGAIQRFFNKAIIDDDKERFFTYIDDPANGVDIATLSSIVVWLMEEYGDRPTSSAQRS